MDRIPDNDDLDLVDLARDYSTDSSVDDWTPEFIEDASHAVETPAEISDQIDTANEITPTRSELISDNVTIRVPVKRLQLLDDLCGELSIGCNGLNLRFSRMRGLMNRLVQRILDLEQSNLQLRNAYDRVATQAMSGLGPSALQLDLTHLRPEGFDILEFDSYSELHPIWQQVMETIVWLQEVSGDMDLLLQDAEQSTFEFNRVSKKLQTAVTQARMRPLNELLNRFPRAIRDLSTQFGKQVDLKVYGGATLVDQTILEKLSDPLLHLLRNAFDHGIEDAATRKARHKSERGQIEIRAGYRGNQTIITISDDGGGINFEKVRAKAKRLGLDSALMDRASDRDLTELLFEPGFSTAETVTSLSGRGVGMDVVRTNLKDMGGTITLDTELGQGTTFTLSVPLTLSVMRILMVEASNGMLMAFPSDTIEQMVLIDPDHPPFKSVANQDVLEWEGYMVPKVNLEAWLTFNCPTRPLAIEDVPVMTSPAILIVSQGEDLVCVPIHRCWSEREVSIRPVEGPFLMPAGFSGCTILGDGQVLPIVNVPDLFTWMTTGSKQAPSLQDPAPTAPQPTQPTVMIVDDSINVRRFLSLMFERAGYQPVEARDGQDALDKLLSGLEVNAVVCDIEMPRLDGFGLLAQVKKQDRFKDLPFVMLTSRTGDKHRQLALRLGAAAYFTKPCKERELIQQVKTLLESGQPVSMQS